MLHLQHPLTKLNFKLSFSFLLRVLFQCLPLYLQVLLNTKSNNIKAVTFPLKLNEGFRIGWQNVYYLIINISHKNPTHETPLFG